MSDRETTESGVRATIESWARSVSDGNRAAILAYHADDLLRFYFPTTVRGLDAYDKIWDFFFPNPRGPIRFEPRKMTVTADKELAFVSCEIHCDGKSAGPIDFRLTTGLRKIDGEWAIVHEHHSVPTDHARLIGPQ